MEVVSFDKRQDLLKQRKQLALAKTVGLSFAQLIGHQA